jgi:hypothetical protein
MSFKTDWFLFHVSDLTIFFLISGAPLPYEVMFRVAPLLTLFQMRTK